MARKSLVIVESPTKANTLSKFLGHSYKVIASYGHVRDLPKSKLGVDVENNFTPQYLVPKEKKERVREIKRELKGTKELILATDPDREGEAISWHIKELVQEEVKAEKILTRRITFHEITEEAIREALAHPGEINFKLVDAQQARRVLDRLVGYTLSPLLWRKVRTGLSAGRVQSVAVRLIVDREKEREAFKPIEYWNVEAVLKKDSGIGKETFKAELLRHAGKEIRLKNQRESRKVVDGLERANFLVGLVKKKDVKKNPYPPFTTSTLQQTAANQLRFTSKKTMKLAQDLYEHGLITYHRTDSLNLSEAAIAQMRGYIKSKFGTEFLSSTPRRYKTKSKVAQEAHEAIRPTAIAKESDSLGNDFGRDHIRLYQLIWQRTISCQMAEALYDQTSVDINAGEYLFRANGSVIKFLGWLTLFEKAKNTVEETPQKLPELSTGEKLNLVELLSEQHFTEPPARYTEASLIKALEERGIGRPSTYAPILSTIVDRNYVERLDGKFQPTPLGSAVNNFLVENFPNIVDDEFTADMENQLDEVASGTKAWVPVIQEFYTPYSKLFESVYKTAERVKIEVEQTEEKCESCGKLMVIRYGRFGKFLACSGYPECKNTKRFQEKINALCPNCGGAIVIKRTKRKRPFYGCSNYPNCNWMSWKKPKEPESGNEGDMETKDEKTAEKETA